MGYGGTEALHFYLESILLTPLWASTDSPKADGSAGLYQDADTAHGMDCTWFLFGDSVVNYLYFNMC